MSRGECSGSHSCLGASDRESLQPRCSLAQPDPLPNASLRRGSGDIALNNLFPSPTF